MKQILIFLFTFTLFATDNRAQQRDVLTPAPFGSVKIGGYTGKKIDLCLANRVMAQDVDRVVIPFAERNDDSRYADELEKTLYNALFASQTPDDEWWSYYTGLMGERAPSHLQWSKNTSEIPAIWMTFNVPVTDEGGGKHYLPMCDYSSAGNTWQNGNLFRVWIPQPFDFRHLYINNLNWNINVTSGSKPEIPELYKIKH
ncbi:MAG: glycoside hydrolase family 127 protein [Tannerella sp.]|jgi:hypothetical protein|nr:glycoside hydrolase family 127 protein [Tannerella sp.]